MNSRSILFAISLFVLYAFVPSTPVCAAQIEKKIVKQIMSKMFSGVHRDQRCQYKDKYVVYLIDNFEQTVELIPEVTTTHGDLLRKILISGRDDIIVKSLNTSLSKGLATVIHDLLQKKCADAVISSIPGSNYSYNQINSFFLREVSIHKDNILDYQEELKKLLKRIAVEGFPSVKWLEHADVNSSKLKNDARMVAFADALGQFRVPILIPYGNKDSSYKNEARSVNILSLVPNVRAYSAFDEMGNKLAEYPHSPLSVGFGQAIFHVKEIPDAQNPYLAHLDINSDDYIDYTFKRKGGVAFRNEKGLLAFSPPLLSDIDFKHLKDKIENNSTCKINDPVVLTANQYRELMRLGLESCNLTLEKEYIWLNSPYRKKPFQFNAAAWIRGLIRGTSLIPPNKVKELLTAGG